jgi:hypothetical protein
MKSDVAAECTECGFLEVYGREKSSKFGWLG